MIRINDQIKDVIIFINIINMVEKRGTICACLHIPSEKLLQLTKSKRIMLSPYIYVHTRMYIIVDK